MAEDGEVVAVAEGVGGGLGATLTTKYSYSLTHQPSPDHCILESSELLV